MKFWFGYRWFCLKLWFRERPEKIAWAIATRLPRKVALFAFVRVCAATGEHPDDITYEKSYKAWEKGSR